MISEFEHIDAFDERQTARIFRIADHGKFQAREQKRIGWGLLLTGVACGVALWCFAGPMVGGAVAAVVGLGCVAAHAARDLRNR